MCGLYLQGSNLYKFRVQSLCFFTHWIARPLQTKTGCIEMLWMVHTGALDWNLIEMGGSYEIFTSIGNY